MSRIELECSLEERCVQQVERLGGLALKLQIPGVRGFPDRTVLMEGRVFFVEFKRSKGGVVSTQQRRWHDRLRRLGFYCATVDSEADFDSLLRERIDA